MVVLWKNARKSLWNKCKIAIGVDTGFLYYCIPQRSILPGARKIDSMGTYTYNPLISPTPPTSAGPIYRIQGMHQEFGYAGAGASWRYLGLKTGGAHKQYQKPQNQQVQRVMSQRSVGSCTRCTRADAFPGIIESRGSQRCNFVLQSALNCLKLKWQLVEHVQSCVKKYIKLTCME